MDLFWLIPVGTVAVILIGVFWAFIVRQPEQPSNPRVLVDKPSSEPSVDEAAKSGEWQKRPCGSFMDWLAKRG
jgi:hypothetical protein